MDTIALWEQEIEENERKEKQLREEAIYNFYGDTSVNEGFLDRFKKKKNKKREVKKENLSPEVKKNLDALNTKASDIVKIVEDEYKNNKKKWDKFLADQITKARGKDFEDDEAEFDIDMDNSFCYFKGDYYIQGNFFNADQTVGFDIEDALEKAFFGAITPKLKKLLGKNFIKIEGDMDDYPGAITIYCKPFESE